MISRDRANSLSRSQFWWSRLDRGCPWERLDLLCLLPLLCSGVGRRRASDYYAGLLLRFLQLPHCISPAGSRWWFLCPCSSVQLWSVVSRQGGVGQLSDWLWLMLGFGLLLCAVRTPPALSCRSLVRLFRTGTRPLFLQGCWHCLGPSPLLPRLLVPTAWWLVG